MPQLLIIPAVFPQPSAGISQVLASAAEGGGVLEVDPGLDFGAVLAKQLKGVATLLEKKKDAELSSVAVSSSIEPDVSAVMLSADVTALAVPMLVLALPVQAGAGVEISAEAVAEKSLMYRNDNELREYISSIPAEANAEKSLMYRNDNELRADISSIPAEANAEKSLMYRNDNELRADIFSIPAEANAEKSLMYRNGNEVRADISSIPVEANAVKSLMHRNGNEVRADISSIPVDATAEEPLIRLSRASEVRLAAEIAENGGNLPQAMSSEQKFDDKLAALVKNPLPNAVGEIHSADLSATANTSAMVAAFRNSESLPALPIVPRVGSVEWGGAVGERVVWMASQSHQVAELHLNPPNLGPLEVRLTISNDQASALFVSHHAAVREAIETALPRLREMLADNGIMLGNVTVGSESFGRQQASEQADGKEGWRGVQGAENVMARTVEPSRPAGLVRDGMVDIFA